MQAGHRGSNHILRIDPISVSIVDEIVCDAPHNGNAIFVWHNDISWQEQPDFQVIVRQSLSHRKFGEVTA